MVRISIDIDEDGGTTARRTDGRHDQGAAVPGPAVTRRLSEIEVDEVISAGAAPEEETSPDETSAGYDEWDDDDYGEQLDGHDAGAAPE